MDSPSLSIYLWIALAPLAGAVIAGLFGRRIGRVASHSVCIAGVGLATVLSMVVFADMVIDGGTPIDARVYLWGSVGQLDLEVGFLIDGLSASMMLVVTFVSLMVHIYTIGYMEDDPGYQRFFSYISLFTFAMLMLVMSNNFLQLFFGWEAVGVVSYLLIGFWYTRESAIRANLKAFLVNRVGDFGFLLGIGAVLAYFGSLHYGTVFEDAPAVVGTTINVIGDAQWSVLTLTCILLFIGAMGKSAQFPLHVWLPDSMEGPTPISALIHAATMVTAGIFMVARMSPLFELSTTALGFVMVVGAITAFFMGLLGLVQHDIKRVVAYSTLSQLGYMTAALGASAYSAAIFHLTTHAFFKALLFLAAGSVIIAMHHEQDMRKMGGLRRYMPITWIVSLIGSLALIGFPGFAGFYSKDAIIEAVKHSSTPGQGFAYLCVLLGVFVTALYSFRMYFLVFHGRPRMDEHTRSHLHETRAVVTVPLILLAIPSVLAGAWLMEPMLFGSYFGDAIQILDEHDSLAEMATHVQSALSFAFHGFVTLPFFLAMLGVAAAFFLYVVRTDLPEQIATRFQGAHRLLENKYGFDVLYERFFAAAGRKTGTALWRVGDVRLIDGLMVDGTAKSVGWFSGVLRHVQTGYLYHYAFVMIAGLLALMLWFVALRLWGG